jgi:AcrR family transcriptional regulator
MKTPEKILEAARTLFNEKGTFAVTTHHIAAACGISPGNLYYHFKNKTEIIRALFDQYLTENRTQAPTADLTKFNEAVDAGIDFTNDSGWRYRFLKYELPQLIKQDNQLREKFLQLHHDHMSETQKLLTQAVDLGGLTPLSAKEKIYLAELSWLIALFWPSLIEVIGDEPSRENLERGMEILRWLLSGPLASKENTTPSSNNPVHGDEL